VAVVVPPFELSTGDVYRRWDQLEGPVGREVEGRRLPPGLRSYGPLRNDLTPAAIALRPELDDWKEDLASTWERPVMMSGSGPALFGFFTDLDEARSASAAVKAARAVAAADLRSTGAALRER
jgi:4-diphosphocytidyl-2-C-methyl-D-erythritol kinase